MTGHPHGEICTTEPQDCVLSWINSPGEGDGAGVQFAALCDSCAGTMWHKLSHYPAALETVTIAPPGGPWHRQLIAEREAA